MAQVPTSHIRRTGKLGDVTSARINLDISQGCPIKADPYCLVPGIKTGVRYSPTQEKHLKQLLNSPHRAQVLRMNGITLDENTFMHTSKQSRNNTRLNSPKIPVSTGAKMTEHYAAASQINMKDVCETPEQINKPSPLDKDLPPKPALRNEESPERRGVFDASDASSRKLNDCYPPLEPDTTQPAPEAPRSSPSDNNSFEMTGSLKTLSDGGSADIEIGVAVQVDLHDTREQMVPSITTSRSANYALSAPRLAERRVASLGHVATHKDGSPIQRKKVNPHDVRVRDALSSKAKAPTDAAIRVLDKELPAAPAETKSESHDALAVGQKEAVCINKGAFMSMEFGDRADSPAPEQNDTPVRRANKYGVGPTIRFSKDAHDVIMGTGPYSSKTTKLKESRLKIGRKQRELKVELASPPTTEANARRLVSSSSNLQASATKNSGANKTISQSSAEIFCQINIKETIKSPFGPRTSSLPGSPEYLGFSNPPEPPAADNSLASRLSRPTKASQARATESKNNLLRPGKRGGAASSPSLHESSKKPSPRTPSFKPAVATTSAVQLRKSASTTSIKKVTKEFKSRLSSIIPNLHRATHSKANIQSLSKPRISEESLIDDDPLLIHANRRSASRNLTTFHNSGMGRSPTEVVHSYPSGDMFSGEPEDKVAPSNDESERRADESNASQIHDQTNRSHFIANGLQQAGIANLRPGGDEEPPTPPQSREGQSGHYAENEQPIPTTNAYIRRPGPGEEAYDETGVGQYLDELLANAEQHFRAVVAATNTEHQPTRDAIAAILTPLAAAVEATRAARMSAIALTNANAELARWVAMLSGRADQAVAAAAATRATPLQRDAPTAGNV